MQQSVPDSALDSTGDPQICRHVTPAESGAEATMQALYTVN